MSLIRKAIIKKKIRKVEVFNHLIIKELKTIKFKLAKNLKRIIYQSQKRNVMTKINKMRLGIQELEVN